MRSKSSAGAGPAWRELFHPHPATLVAAHLQGKATPCCCIHRKRHYSQYWPCTSPQTVMCWSAGTSTSTSGGSALSSACTSRMICSQTGNRVADGGWALMG